MKNRELIEILSEFDPDDKVFISLGEEFQEWFKVRAGYTEGQIVIEG